MDLDRVSVAQGLKPVLQGVISASELSQRVDVLVGPVNELQCLVCIEFDGVLFPVFS